ncbi:unnamed protein product [Candida verbasci]|uniref:Serine/threonine-protein kinase Tel1 n=1 Tax=Candida verbasci TaxID=1227364 RepID=A0A9W4XCL3_9ASCO|nr:unnamed protein product [Candida verbasci]
MTSLIDINKLTGLLQSSKIKDRNDALNELENFTISKFKLSTKQFKSLITAILKLIELEAGICSTNKSSTVDTRLSKGSYNLRLLIEKSINSTINVRYRTYIDLLLNVKEIFYYGDEALEPCSIDFIKISSSILSLQYVKDHLNKNEWQLIYNFLIKSITHALKIRNNEKIMIELFNSLQFLLHCESSVSINYLHLYKNDNYFELLSIISKILECFKKDSLLMVYLMRILNKLIIILSTVNFKVVNKLISSGILLMNQFYHTKFEKLQDQFLIFLNLKPTHNLIDLAKLPKLVGDNLFLNENEDSIITEDDDDDENNNDHDKNNQYFISKLNILLQNLIDKLLDNGSSLNFEDIGITFTGQIHTWYKLKSIHLKSPNYQSWLLYLGVTKLLNTYFDLKSSVSSQSNPSNVLTTSFVNRGKQQKLNTLNGALANSSTFIEFLNRLTSCKSSELQLLGLKFLIFHFENGSQQVQDANLYDSDEEEHEQTTFDYFVSNDGSRCDVNILVKNVLETFDQQELNFWSLLATRTLLNNKLRDSFISQILKVSILSVKLPNLYPVACNLIFNLVNLDLNYSNIIDDSIMNQLESIIDLSEINGPWKISNEGFQFWFAIHKLSIDVNLANKNKLSSKIQDWLIAKWESTFNPMESFENIEIELFLCWILSGNSLIYNRSEKIHDLYDECLNEVALFSEHYQSVESFLTLKEEYSIEILAPIEIGSIVIGDKVSLLMKKVSKTNSVFTNESIDSSCSFKWIMTICKILSKIITLKDLTNETFALKYQVQVGLESISDISLSSEDIFSMFHIFNNTDIDYENVRQFIITKLPFDKLISTLKGDYPEVRPITRKRTIEEANGIDAEFSTVRDITSPILTSTKDNYSYLQFKNLTNSNLEGLKFILKISEFQNKSEADKLVPLMSYIENLKPDDLLPAILFIIDNVIVKLEGDFETVSLIKLTRILGDRLLSNQIYERHEFTLVVVSKLLYTLFPLIQDSIDEGFIKDFNDICNWIYQCGLKNLIPTEFSTIEYCKFLLQFIIYNDEKLYSNTELKVTLLTKFATSPNNIKYKLIKPIVNYIQILDLRHQSRLYNELFQNFFNPEQSVESGGTYAIFFTELSSGSRQILHLSLFNLLECSRFSFFIPYLRICLTKFCKILDVLSPLVVFKQLKFEILKSWWRHDLVHQFPYTLFGYSDLHTFYRENYKELIAIALSSKTSKLESVNQLLETLTDLKQTNVKNLISQSMSLIIPLSYTKEGARNDVFQKLIEYLQDSFKGELIDKLSLIVLEIIRFTDVLDEKLFLQLFPGNEIAFNLVDSSITKIIEKPGDIKLSFDSSVELIKKLVSKYSESFWSSKQIYFLIRRVDLLIKETQLIDQIRLHLRKIKLILALGENYDFMNYDVTKLLIKILSPLVKYGELTDDISLIFLQFKGLYNDDLNAGGGFYLVLEIVQFLLNVKSVNTRLVIAVERYLRSLQKVFDTSILNLLLLAIDSIKGKPTTINSSLVENSLKSNLLNPELIMKLMSTLFDKVTILDHKGGSITVVKTITNNDLQDLSKSFKLWIFEYLSDFYLRGGTCEYDKLYEMDEYIGIPTENFQNDVSSFDYTFKMILEYVNSDNSEAAACAESVLGVLIHIQNTNPHVLLKYLQVNTRLESYQDSIIPIEFHTCVLLNDTSNVDHLGDNLNKIINNLDVFLREDQWYTKLYLAILQELASFTSIVSLISTFVIKVPEFAKEALPSLIGYYLKLVKEAKSSIVKLFENFISCSSKSKLSIKILLDVLVLIRIGTKLNIPSYKEVYNNVNLSKYSELATEVKLYKIALILFEDRPANLENDYLKLQHIYENLDDDDLIYGLPERTSMEHTLSMIQRFGTNNEKLQYSNGLLDANLKLNQSFNNDILKSISSAGLFGVSRIMSKNLTNLNIGEEPYEWSWKLSKWDLPIPKTPKSENEVIYKVLKQINDYPDNMIDLSESSMLELLNQKIAENKLSMSVKDFKIHNKKWLKTIASVSSILDVERNADQSISIFSEKTRWVEELCEFDMLENVLLARQTTFQLLNDNGTLNNGWFGAANQLVRYNDLARMCNEFQKTVSSTVLLDKLCDKFGDDETITNVNNLSLFQSAKTLWSQGNYTRMPIQMLQEVYNNGGINFSNHSIDKCLIQAMMIDWLSESHQELSTNIMDKYVLSTASMAENVRDLPQQSKIFKLLAQFCESQYKSKSLSEQVEKLTKRVNDKIAEIDELKNHYSKISVSAEEKKSVQRFYTKLKMQLSSEDNDLKSLKDRKELFGRKAAEYYLNNILVGEFNEENLDKFFALWLEQSNNRQLNNDIKNKILNLPSYKLITWCTQLISRLGSETTEFQQILQKLIINMCIDHPYHSLYLLISLGKHKDSAQDNPLLTSKCSAVNKIWSQLMRHDQNYITNILNPITLFCDECVILAETKVGRGRTMNLEKYSFGDFWISNLPAIPPPTKDLPIDPTMKYKNIPTFKRIDNKIVIASSGLSLPKIAKFYLSNGMVHRILFKHGTDDLRQDLIMEQVFKKVNNIFKKDRECNKRNLIIRTYNAIPIGPTAGIIEFVPNSTALIDVIKPYHQSLDKMKIEKAREFMKLSQTKSKIERLQEFNKIEEKIKPVLHLFFQHTFLTPDSWFESRIKYTHGIASSSIVGYILGLGDRHCNNILLDKSSGEPIHIDLGVAFDQGKRLPIPETVPFRLTRDIIDGFGITGVEGIFKKSCEHTFRVLKLNKDHIISILDVLRWDPLYSWGISPIRKKRLQDEEDGEIILQPQDDGTEAGRAVSNVIDKLNANGLSTEAIISELIQEATDPQNLALIYFGWCPFY